MRKTLVNIVNTINLPMVSAAAALNWYVVFFISKISVIIFGIT